MSIATLLPALAVGALLWRGEPGPATATLLAVAGIVLALCALATVACTAMIYASLKPIPAWRHPLVLPVYLPFALLPGPALLFAQTGRAAGRERGGQYRLMSGGA